MWCQVPNEKCVESGTTAKSLPFQKFTISTSEFALLRIFIPLQELKSSMQVPKKQFHHYLLIMLDPSTNGILSALPLEVNQGRDVDAGSQTVKFLRVHQIVIKRSKSKICLQGLPLEIEAQTQLVSNKIIIIIKCHERRLCIVLNGVFILDVCKHI